MTPGDFLKLGYDHACAELRAHRSFPPFAAVLPRNATSPRILFAEDGSVETLRATIVERRRTEDLVLAALFTMGTVTSAAGAARTVISVHLEGMGHNKLAVTPYDFEAGQLRLGTPEVFAAGNRTFLPSV